MNERSKLISKLQSDFKTRAAYVQAKVGTLVPSQIRALRTKSSTPRQPDLASAAEMHQSRISMLETAGANPTLSTLSTIAAALRVGLKVEFVPFSEMLDWENGFSQDDFDVVSIDRDMRFLHPDFANTSDALGTSLCLPCRAVRASESIDRDWITTGMENRIADLFNSKAQLSVFSTFAQPPINKYGQMILNQPVRTTTVNSPDVNSPEDMPSWMADLILKSVEENTQDA